MWKNLRALFPIGNSLLRWREIKAPLLEDVDKSYDMDGVELPVGTIDTFCGTRKVQGSRWYVCDVETTVYGPYEQERDAAKAYVRALVMHEKTESIPAYTPGMWRIVLHSNDQYCERKGLPRWSDVSHIISVYGSPMFP